MDGRSVFALALGAVMLPAAAATAYFLYTGDPSLRPLGVTQESLATGGADPGFIAIAVRVDLGRDRPDALTRAALRRFIARAMAAKTTDYFVTFRERPGTAVGITLEVGANRYGPFPPDGLAAGVQTAAVALEMARR